MKNKKKLIAIAVIILLIVAAVITAIFLITNNDEDELSLHETIENRADSYKTDFKDSMHLMTNQKSIAKYLVNWAENKGINVKTDSNNNVIYSFDATEGLEDNHPTVILCGYDYASIQSNVNSIACALTTARGDMEHGEFKIIFVSEENGNKFAVNKLPASYFPENAEVFYLGNDTASKIATSTSGSTDFQFTKKLDSASPNYNKAYKVTIAGLPTEALSSRSVSIPNPIKTLGNLLANFKSKSVLFDLVEFTGGNGETLTPGEASITIVVSQDATEKVETRLDSAIESFVDKYGKKYPEATYAYEVVDMPSRVIASNDTESLISLLYTAPNGVYYKDDDGNVTTTSCITSIDTTTGKVVIDVTASGYEKETLDEVSESYATICALTDIEFKELESLPIYVISEKGKALASAFTNSYNEYKSNTLNTESMAGQTMCSALSEKYPDMNLIAIGVTNKTKDNFAGGLMVHMSKAGA
ncbi:MAG: hypothetical protein IKU53_03170 [Firmicutes bacterium]|nr:hypothetical protein [Bacillota bacterium]